MYLAGAPSGGGGATPAGVVIVMGIPFAYSGGGGIFPRKKKVFECFF